MPGVTFVSPNDVRPRSNRAVTERPRRSSSSRFRAKAACGRCRRRSPRRSKRRARAPARCSSADEIQCGPGRTGRDVPLPVARPDARSGVGGEGASAAASRSARRCVSEEVASAIAYGDHGTTYGGNLLACRAALYVLDQLDERPARSRRARSAPVLEQGLRAMRRAPRPRRRSPRQGTDVGRRSRARRRRRSSRTRCPRADRQSHVGDRSIRLLPPYVITEAEMRPRPRATLEAALSDWCWEGSHASAERRGRRRHRDRCHSSRRSRERPLDGRRRRTIRRATVADVPAILRADRREPRRRAICCRGREEDVTRTRDALPRRRRSTAGVVGCAELAPLSRAVAEVRSLVVDESCRGRGFGSPHRRGAEALGAAATASRRCARSRIIRAISSGSAFRSCRTRGCPRRSRPTASAARSSARCEQYAMALALRGRLAADDAGGSASVSGDAADVAPNLPAELGRRASRRSPAERCCPWRR